LYEGRVCAPVDSENDARWCNVVPGSCDVAGKGWDECEFKAEQLVWAGAEEEKMFADFKPAALETNLRFMIVTAASCDAGYIPDNHGGCAPVSIDDSFKCAEGQLLNERTDACVTPDSTDPKCASDELLNEATGACVTPESTDPKCASDELLNEVTGACVSTDPKCTENLLLDERTGECESKRSGTYVCDDGKVLDERANTCSTPMTTDDCPIVDCPQPTEECDSGYAREGNKCKFICGSGGERKLEVGSDEPCITVSDSPDDCGGINPPEEKVVVVEAVLKFENFPVASMPAKGSPEEKTFETAVGKGIAASLGYAESAITVVSVTLDESRRRKLTGSVGKLIVDFKVNVPKQSDSITGDEEEALLITKLTAADESGSLVQEISDAAVEEMGSDESATWTGVEPDTESITVEAEEQEPDVGDEDPDNSGVHDGAGGILDGKIKTVAMVCGGLAGVGVIGLFISCFARSSEGKEKLLSKSKNRRSDDGFGFGDIYKSDNL
jgi:hypothetical protein